MPSIFEVKELDASFLSAFLTVKHSLSAWCHCLYVVLPGFTSQVHVVASLSLQADATSLSQ